MIPLEVLQQAIQETGMSNLYTSQEFPEKFCSADRWEGNLQEFAEKIVDLCNSGWYLDCYQHGAMCGKEFPTDTYGPATLIEILEKQKYLQRDASYDHYEVTQTTKGTKPVRLELW